MRVRHLNCGTMRPPLRRWINGEGGVLRAATMVCHCLLLETDDGCWSTPGSEPPMWLIRGGDWGADSYR